jgi:hypothetical protein
MISNLIGVENISRGDLQPPSMQKTSQGYVRLGRFVPQVPHAHLESALQIGLFDWSGEYIQALDDPELQPLSRIPAKDLLDWGVVLSYLGL